MLLAESASTTVALPPLRDRLKWFMLMMVAAFGLLFGRLWQLQILRGDSYLRETMSNVVHERYLPPVRGKILDRFGTALADNRPAFNIYVRPRKLKPDDLGKLTSFLGLSDEEAAQVESRIATRRDKSAPVLILEDQGRERAAMVDQTVGPSRDAIEVRAVPYRYYPGGSLAAHAIGYLSRINQDEFAALEGDGYHADDLIGKAGLEKTWESYLRGKRGVERYAVDAQSRRLDEKTTAELIPGERLVPAVPGSNLILTLDSKLQRAAERAVGGHLASAVAVVEIATGKIRALVSKPSLDPNVMTGHLTRAEETLLMSDPRKPYIDKATRVPYPPGSTYKFVTAFAALEDGLGKEDERQTCVGAYELSGTTFKCTAAHGPLDLLGAIQHSCNVYFWQWASRIGLDRMSEVAREYGFGSPTNLGISGDVPGRVPTKAWYEQRGAYKLGHATNASTGQGDVEVTVLQLAMAYAAIAHGQTLFIPLLVERVETHEGETVVAFSPRAKGEIHTPPDVLDVWRRGMWSVVNAPGGTAYEHARSSIVAIAGKTGTAEVRKQRSKRPERDVPGWHPTASHAWFAGWAPAEAPEIAIVVLIEHGGSGGKVAGPVARTILESYFAERAPPPASEEP